MNYLLVLLGGLWPLLLSPLHAVPIDNGVIGEPAVNCGPSAIRLDFNTQNAFNGKIFVKGHYKQADCSRDFGAVGGATDGLSIDVPFMDCGTKRTRSANPRGVFVSTTVVIQFHPMFLTKVDRAYRIQCFYMEADKTVAQDLDVSMLTTEFVEQMAEMPVCTYTIHKDSPDGPVSRFFRIGDPVYHRWECTQPSGGESPFGMLVHSCFVSDGQDQQIMLVENDGCSLDPYILNHLEYGPDLTLAIQPAHVFKFADQAEVQFRCQIRLCHKALGTCQGMTPPRCPELRNKRRRKRTIINHGMPPLAQRVNRTSVYGAASARIESSSATDFDVQSDTLVVIEPSEILIGYPGNDRSSESRTGHRAGTPAITSLPAAAHVICMAPGMLTACLLLLVGWSVSLVIVTIVCTWQRCFTGQFDVRKTTLLRFSS